MAILDLQEIHDYIAKDNPDAAWQLMDRLDRRFTTLCDHPGIGRKREEVPGLRSFTEGNYLILYRLADEDSALEIARILHSKRDLNKALND